MKKYTFLILAISLIGIFSWVYFAQAGFGISPPAIINDHLIPGQSFEKTIYLVRGQPTEELRAEITIEAPEIEEWITIEKGLSFPLPKDIQQVPMKVIINVPEDTDFGFYHGYIRVRAISSSQEGQVTTVLAGRIEISLAITDEEVSNFRLRGVSVSNVEQGNSLVVLIMLENTGNVKIRPSKVHLDIYDVSHRKLLKSGDITETSWAGPFETKQVEGELPIDLEIGEYWADVTIYKAGESLGLSKVYFKVVPKIEEKLPEERKRGFLSSCFSDPVLGIGIILLIVLIIIVIWISKKKIRKDSNKKINSNNKVNKKKVGLEKNDNSKKKIAVKKELPKEE